MATCGTITVEQSFDASAVTISNCSLGTTNVSPGQSFDVTATVQNNNDAPASALARVFVNGSQVGETDVALDANGSRTVTFTVSAPNATGDHSVSMELAGVASEIGASAPYQQDDGFVSIPIEGRAATAGGTSTKEKDDCGCGCGGSCGGSQMTSFMPSFDVGGAFDAF